MNKYQEALNFLCEHATEWSDDYDWDENPIGEYVPIDEHELKAYIQPLQELIDRATPRKLDVTRATLRCPTCKKEVTRRCMIKRNIKYCSRCGQALDWSDEE